MKDAMGPPDRLNLVIDKYPEVEIARMCGVSRSTPGKWKKGTPPGSDKLAKLCRWLGISANWLLLGVGPEKLSDCAVDQKNGKVIGRIEKPQDKVAEAMKLIEDWVRVVDKPDQRAWAIVDELERKYPEFVEWQKKRAELGECGTSQDSRSANGE